MRVLDARREVLLQPLHQRLDLVGRVERVGAGPLEHADADRRLAVEVGLGDVVLLAELDAGDVLDPDEPPVRPP